MPVDFGWTLKLNGMNFRALDEISRLALEREFSEKEIFEGLSEVQKGNAPGPNAFNMGFL